VTDAGYDARLRLAAFAHLSRLREDHPSGALASSDINTFLFEGRHVPLVVQTGIWKPAVLDGALSIRTTYTSPSQLPPYEDVLGDDGFLRYKYRGTDPQHSDNCALRTALHGGLPLAYFVGVTRASTSRTIRSGWSRRMRRAVSSRSPCPRSSGCSTRAHSACHNGTTSPG
jgi:putative restriction endonuclease